MKHHPCGPSKLALREACPGSLALHVMLFGSYGGAETASDTPDQARGRDLHLRMQHAVESGTVRVDGLAIEDAAALLWCFEQIAPLVASARENGALVLTEHEIELDGISGTVDLALVTPGGMLCVFDYKFGRRWRTPWRQVQAYACGIACMFGCSHGSTAAVWPSLEHVDSVHASPDTLRAWRTDIQAIVANANAPDAPLRPGEHCDHCPCADRCPARERAALTVMDAQPISPVQAIAKVPAEQRLAYYERLRLARAWIDSALRMIDESIVAKHLDVPGLAVGAGRSSRQWVNEVEASRVLTEVLGEAAYTHELLSPARAEAVLGKARAKSLLATLIHTKPGAPRVVRDGTKGPLDD